MFHGFPKPEGPLGSPNHSIGLLIVLQRPLGPGKGPGPRARGAPKKKEPGRPETGRERGVPTNWTMILTIPAVPEAIGGLCVEIRGKPVSWGRKLSSIGREKFALVDPE